MKNIKFLCLATILIFFHSSYSQDKKSYSNNAFHSVEVSNAVKLILNQSEEFSIWAKIPEGLERQFTLDQKSEELKIYIKGKSTIKEMPEVTINMPELKELVVRGASEVLINSFQGDNIVMEISGASEVRGEISYNDLDVKCSGASEIEVEGTANSARVYLSGASEFDKEEFKINGDLILEMTGASEFEAEVNGDIYLKLSGASEADLYGNGNIVKQEIKGASSVDKH